MKVYSTDEELYYEDFDSTVDELICLSEPGDIISVFEGDAQDVQVTDVLNFDRLVENIYCEADDNLYQLVGEASENNLEIKNEDIFTKRLKNLCEEHFRISCFAVKNVKETKWKVVLVNDEKELQEV